MTQRKATNETGPRGDPLEVSTPQEQVGAPGDEESAGASAPLGEPSPVEADLEARLAEAEAKRDEFVRWHMPM